MAREIIHRVKSWPIVTKKDRLEEFRAYQLAKEAFTLAMKDTESMMRDPRGKVPAIQLTASTDSICANMEEGFGRGTKREYAQFLRISRGSARESKGRYERCSHWLNTETIEDRVERLDHIIAILVQAIRTLRKPTDGG